MKEGKSDKIYDYPLNDSRIPICYHIVDNESLGGGGFGEVFKVQRETAGEDKENNQFFALKKIKKEGIINEKDKHYRVLSEIKIHRTLRNKYICKYEHSFEDDQAIYIVMEYCEKKSLDDYLKTRKSFTEYETRYYMFQVLLGLKYLRRKKVIHRDLTLANLFLKDYKTIKIGDFGLSYIETENEEKPGLMCGTQGYFTPESLQTKYSYKTDIFCFGVCIYHMMTGLTLFKDAASSFDMIKKSDINYDEKTKFSKQCKDLFEQIFVFENKRIDLDDIFVHPFFNKGKGLIDVDFPNYFDDKMSKKEFEEKIKILEKDVIMTDVSYFPKKNELLNKKNNEFSGDNNDNINNNSNSNKKKDFFQNSIQNMLMKNKRKDNISIKDKSNSNDNKNNVDNQGIIIKEEKNNININNDLTINIKDNKEPASFKDQSAEKDVTKENSEKKLSLLILDELNKKKEQKQKKEETNEIRKSLPKLNLADVVNENEEESNEKNSEEDNNNNNNNNNYFNEVETLKPEENNNSMEKLDISSEKMNSMQNIYIKNIIQESTKFGIGYQLNNDDIGILFNDDSIMTKFSQYKNLIYYRKQHNFLYKIIIPLKSTHDKDLIKKIEFFGYIIEETRKKKSRMQFTNEEENSKNDSSFVEKMVDENKKNYVNKTDVYLLKYKKNYQAHYFILSNNNIQIKYNDGSDVIFCCAKNKKIIYINHNGNKTEFELGLYKDFSSFTCKDPKINKKIKYAIKEILK